MLRVIYANQLELLATILGEAMPHGDPFATTEVIVSHPIVGRWLMLELCRQYGGVAGVNISLLDKFALQTAVAQQALPIAPLSRTALTSLICSELAEDAALAAAVRLGGSEDAPPKAATRRRVEMAEGLASLLLEYARTRPAWLDAWGDGKLDEGIAEATAHLAWQPKLYRAILRRAQLGINAQGKAGKGATARDVSPLPVMAPRALRAIAKRTKELAVENVPLHVLGFSYLAPSDLETLQILAAHREVIVYQINPSADYWFDTPRRTGAFAKQRAFAADQVATANLRLWATPVRDTVTWLLEHASVVDGVFAKPTAAINNDFTRWQQRTLAPSDAANELSADVGDDSVRIHACPSPLRELEVAVDLLLRRVAASPEAALPDAAILVAGRDTDTYLALAPLVFAARGKVPFHLADSVAAGRATLADGLVALLQLAERPVTRSSLLGVMCHPGLSVGTPAQCERWPELAEKLGIYVGADGDELTDTYLQNAGVAHWDQGLARLALGAFMSGPALGDWREALATGHAWLPADSTGADSETAALFVSAARSLLADVRAVKSKRASLASWCRAIRQLASVYGNGDTDQAAQDQIQLASALTSLLQTDFDERIMEVAEFSLRFARCAAAGQQAHRSAQLLCDGVYVGQLSTMRPLPFRHVAVVGLGDQLFPQVTQANPLDLRVERRRGDVNPQEHDRQAFFDALLATRESVALCYSACEQSDGTPLEPSPVLAELARMLAPGVGVKAALDQLTTPHPLYAWDDPHVPADLAVVQAMAFPAPPAALEHLPAESPWRGVFGVVPRVAKLASVPERISISALRKFLERPADGWAQIALGVAADAGAADEGVDADTEVFRAKGLDQTVAVREALVDCWRRGVSSPAAVAASMQAALKKRQVDGAWPFAVLGAKQAERWAAYLQQWLGQPALAQRQDVWQWRLGATAAAAAAGGEILPAQLSVEVVLGGTSHAVEVVGTTECVGSAAGLMMLHSKEKAGTGAWLRVGLDRVICAAAGLCDALPNRRASVLLTPKLEDVQKQPTWVDEAELPAWSRSDARQYVQTLLVDLLGQEHAYRINLDKPGHPPSEEVAYPGNFLDDSGFGAPADLADLVARRYQPLMTEDQWKACTMPSRKKKGAA